jgi:hypothetical protein
MAGLVALNLRPDRRTLRQFGVIAFVGFGLLAVLAWREAAMFALGLGQARVPVACGLGALAIYCLAGALVYPWANRPVYLGISMVSFPIGLGLSYVVLAALFFLVIGPVALVMRLAGRDPIKRGYEDAGSYWNQARRRRSPESYFHQF